MSKEEDRVLDFCKNWRMRLLAIPVRVLPEEQFGQLVTLNTIIYYIEEMGPRGITS